MRPDSSAFAAPRKRRSILCSKRAPELSARGGKILFAALGPRPHSIRPEIFQLPAELAPSARDRAAGPPGRQKDLTSGRAWAGVLNRRRKVSRTVPGHAKTPGRPRPSSRATVPAPRRIPREKDQEKVSPVRDLPFFSSGVSHALSFPWFSSAALLPPAPSRLLSAGRAALFQFAAPSLKSTPGESSATVRDKKLAGRRVPAADSRPHTYLESEPPSHCDQASRARSRPLRGPAPPVLGDDRA